MAIAATTIINSINVNPLVLPRMTFPANSFVSPEFTY
jgi:hypothetical protein